MATHTITRSRGPHTLSQSSLPVFKLLLSNTSGPPEMALRHLQAFLTDMKSRDQRRLPRVEVLEDYEGRECPGPCCVTRG